MVTKLKNITFTFENCDRITIDGKYVGDFLVDDLKTYFVRVASNCISKNKVANTFAIEIHKDANKERHQFNQIQLEVYKQMTFDRFKCRDITSIEFELEERYVEEDEIPCVEHYDYWVDWVGESEYENNAQTNYINKEGNLYIVIAKDKGIEDFFDMDEINDEEWTNFKFSMYDR